VEGNGPSGGMERQQSTDNQGKFEFLYEGLGSKPKDKITWILIFEHPEYLTKQIKIDLFWVKEKYDAMNYGYVKKDIIVHLDQ
jgi:hypothetical protein